MPDAARTSIIHLVHSLTGGGTERTLVALLRAMNPARLCHTVVTMRAAGSLATTLPNHIACQPFDLRGTSRTVGFKLARTLKRRDAHVLHARNTGCWTDALLASILSPGVRLVLGFHGLETHKRFATRHVHVARWARRIGARFTCVSLAGKRKLCDEIGLPASSIEVIPNGVDLERFGHADASVRASCRAAWQINHDDFVLGIVGSLVPVKGHGTLLDAVASLTTRHPHLRLLLVGEGSLHEALVRQAGTLGITNHVRFTGRQEDLPALLAGLDAYVCASSSEGMSNALLEAMAAGLAIVATDVGDHATMVRDERDGLIVAPCSSAAMADAIDRLVTTRLMARRFGAAARRRAQAYDFSESVAAYEGYYLRQSAEPARQA